MADEPDSTPIHNVYAQRFAADLEVNRKEQETITAQLTDLGARLAQLKSDEGWLSGMQGTLPAAPVAPAPVTPDADTTVVPRPRTAKKATAVTAGTAGKAATKTARPRKTAAKTPAPAPVVADTAAVTETTAPSKAATPAKVAAPTKAATPAKSTARKTPARKTAAPAAKASTEKAAKASAQKEPATAAATGATEPPRRELVLALLVSAAEPRMVSEVAGELAQAHPERPASTQVVRNTLELLAKKGLIEKENKQGSVMYSAPRPGTPEQAAAATPAAGATTPTGTTGSADETAAAPAPVGV
ncbi:hypothetical protein ACIBEA_04040 [Streptomyces sp. NPDC051555]|uniref:hypothetical protein n=1 Tax=Streptomyces sp. NPDC051555 TaxID=3365657 RepID=UPI0037ACE642